MDIRDQRPELLRAPDVVLVPGPRPTEPAPDTVVARGRAGRAAVVLVAALSLVAVGVVLGRTVWRPDGGLVTGGAAANRPAPAALEGLQLQVSGPDVVTAGDTAVFRIRWQDDEGTFSGTSEEWGDGVGASSEQLPRCDSAAAVAGPARGSVQVRHSWAAPGQYLVRLGVHTFTCRDGVAVVETVERSLEVQVRAGSAP